MNYTVPVQNFPQMVTDMSRRHRLTPEQVAREAVRLLEADPPKPPENATKLELLAWEIARTPSHGLQEEVNRAFMDLVEENRRPKGRRAHKNETREPT